jgi:hypothetical protein
VLSGLKNLPAEYRQGNKPKNSEIHVLGITMRPSRRKSNPLFGNTVQYFG